MKSMRLWALLILAVMCSACASTPVQPWQRGTLAKAGMALEPDPLLGAYRRHTQFSKEAASGGAALAGGGCGCN